MGMLSESFFGRATVDVARELLGATLSVRSESGLTVAGRIVETEAYGGPEDPASHAARGPTPRSQIMFGPPGHTYIYLIYGMYHCLNFVTEPEGIPGAVLIRALEPVSGQPTMARRRNLAPGDYRPEALCAGPGKLCQALGLDLTWNGTLLTGSAPGAKAARRLTIASAPGPCAWQATARVGITKGKDLRHRFYIFQGPQSHP